MDTNERQRHEFVAGISGRSKKYRPNNHCHGYILKTNQLNEEIIVKSIYDVEHIKDVCFVVLSIDKTNETYRNLSEILNQISDIQPVTSYDTSKEFKTVTVIDLDTLQKEERLPEIKGFHFDESYRFSGYADFITKEEIWMEAMRYFYLKNK